MKTKQLLTAMALPLFFAACSQEEIVNENATNDLASRKVVGEVTINLDEESMSRMAFVGGDTPYKWETGDQFGACLMDEATEKTPDYNVGFWNRFTLVDYIHTNYPFTRQKDGSWTSEAVMSEGNYFFYYPFNNNLGGRRSAIKLDIPTEQVLADGAKATSALDQQLFVGYSSVKAKVGKDKESVTLNMEPLLAFPGFRLKNTGTTTVKVRKIAFHSEGETFPIQYEVKPAKANFNAVGYETEGWNATKKRDAIVSVADATSKASQVSLTFGTKGKTLKSQNTTLGYIMLPPMKVAKPKLYIYTDKGLGVADLSVAHVDAGTSSGDNTTNITNDRALTSIKYNDGAIVNVTFDDTALDQPLQLDVRSTDELVDLVLWSKDNTDASLVANLLTNDVELDPQVVTMLKNNKKINLTINGSGKIFTIPANSDVNAINLSNIALNISTVEIAKGAEINVPHLANVGNIVTNSGSTINLINNVTHPYILNEGTINIVGKDTNSNGLTEASFENKVLNKGLINVNATENTVFGELENQYMATVNFNKATTSVDEIENAFNDNGNGTYSRGLMTIAKGATLNVEEGTNNGLITNNGTLKGELVNDVVNKYWASWRYLYVDSEIANNGVINGIVNNGLVKMITNEARIITDELSEGDIDNTVQSPYVTKADNESIIARLSGELKASEIVAVVKGTNASKLYLSGTLTLDPAKDKDGDLIDIKVVGQQPTLDVIAEGNLSIEGEGKIIFYADKGNSTFADFTVKANTTTTIKTNSTIAVGYLKGDGKLLIQSGAIVKVKYGCTIDKENVENYGTLE